MLNHIKHVTSPTPAETPSLDFNKYFKLTSAKSTPLQPVLVRCATQIAPQRAFVETLPAGSIRIAYASYDNGQTSHPSSSHNVEPDDEDTDSLGSSSQVEDAEEDDEPANRYATELQPVFNALIGSSPTIIITPPEDQAIAPPHIRPQPGFLDGTPWDLSAYHLKIADTSRAQIAAGAVVGNLPMRMRIWQTRTLARKYKLPGGVPEEIPFIGATAKVRPTPVFVPPHNRHVTFASLPQRALPSTRLLIPIDITPRLVPVPSIIVTPPEEPDTDAPLTHEEVNANLLDGNRFDFGLYWRTLCHPAQALHLRDFCRRDRLVHRRVQHVFGVARKLGYPTPSFDESEQIWTEQEAERVADMKSKWAKTRAPEEPIARRYAHRSLYR